MAAAPIQRSLSTFLLVVCLLFTVTWWIVGFVLNNQSAWWNVVTIAGIIASLTCVWMEAVKIMLHKAKDPELDAETGALSALAEQGTGRSSGQMAVDASGNVRMFASLEDAKNHGWSFEEEIGSFDGKPLFRVASFHGRHWVFDGLSSQVFNPSLAETVRVFGRLKYKELVSVLDEAGAQLQKVVAPASSTATVASSNLPRNLAS